MSPITVVGIVSRINADQNLNLNSNTAPFLNLEFRFDPIQTIVTLFFSGRFRYEIMRRGIVSESELDVEIW